MDASLLLDFLNIKGPGQTPLGKVDWTRSFPMGADDLAFSVCLEHTADRLGVSVQQSEGQQKKPILEAHWKSAGGAWVFEAATMDGAPVTETASIATFHDYVGALAVEPVVSPPPGASRPRPF